MFYCKFYVTCDRCLNSYISAFVNWKALRRSVSAASDISLDAAAATATRKMPVNQRRARDIGDHVISARYVDIHHRRDIRANVTR